MERQELDDEPKSPLLTYPPTARSELCRELMATALAQVSIANVQIGLHEDCISII